MAYITTEDFRQKSEITLMFFDDKKNFLKYLNDCYIDTRERVTFNTIITTSDGKILLLKRKNSFSLDCLYLLLIKNRKYFYDNFINILKNLNWKEVFLLRKTISLISEKKNEEHIKSCLFNNTRDRLFVQKIYIVGKYIHDNHKFIFEKISKKKKLQENIDRKITVTTDLKKFQVSISKKSEILVLPGGKKKRSDKSIEDIVHRETFEELGKNINFTLTLDYYHIIKSTIYDKITKEIFHDITLIATINKLGKDISKDFKINREISFIDYITPDNKTFDEIKNVSLILLLSVLKNIN